MTNVIEVQKHLVPTRHADLKLEERRAVGWYCRDDAGRYSENAALVKYLVMPRSLDVNFDLTVRHHQDESKTAGGHVDHLYKWIVAHSRDASGRPQRPDFTFIGARAYIGRILRALYNGEEGWDLYAARVHGVIYLYMEKLIKTNQGTIVAGGFFDTTGSDVVVPLRLDDRDMTQLLSGVDADTVLKSKKLTNMGHESEGVFFNAVLSRHGHKFEQYLLADVPEGVPNPRQPIRRFDDMTVVMRASLGRHRLLYMGEVDGLPDGRALSDLEHTRFVELKTVRENVNKYTFKRYKSVQYWAQCVTSNCDRLLLGYRDDARGVVRRLELIDVDTLPRNAEGLWSPEVCYGFLNDVLDLVKKTVNDAPEDTVFQFQWRPKTPDVVRAARLPTSRAKAWVIPGFYREWLDSIPSRGGY